MQWYKILPFLSVKCIINKLCDADFINSLQKPLVLKSFKLVCFLNLAFSHKIDAADNIVLFIV